MGGWSSRSRGMLAFALVGTCGRFNGPQVLSLAVAAGFVFADLGKREQADSATSPSTDHLGSVLQLAFALLLAGAAFDNRGPAAFGQIWGRSHAATLHGLGVGLIFSGVGLRQWAVAAMGRHFTVQLRVLDGHRVIREGPYRWLRHPNYLGLFLVALGTLAIFRSPCGLAILGGVWLPAMILRIQQEERLLCRELGSAYRTYKRDTWRLLPFVY